MHERHGAREEERNEASPRTLIFPYSLGDDEHNSIAQ